MQERTALVLEQLRRTAWFANFGTPISSSDILAVSCWDDAMGYGGKPEWECLRLDIMNQESNVVLDHFGDDAFPWNDVADEIRPQIRAMTEKSLASLGLSPRGHDVVRAQAGWDTLLACLEVEYSDLVTCEFYRRLLRWYLEGHWPCGWEGKYPSGKLIVL